MHWNRAPSRTAVLTLALSVLAGGFARADEVPIEDAIGRECVVFNNTLASVPIHDAVSREFSLLNQLGQVAFDDAISREYAIFNSTGPVEFLDAVSREYAVYNAPPPEGFVDAISRECTVYNNTSLAVDIEDAVSREFTVYNNLSTLPSIEDAHSREYAIWNLNPADAAETRPAPSALTLLPARPNPFTRKTTIQFGLPRSGRADLAVYDVAGRKVLSVLDDAALAAGWHTVSVDGSRLANGFYFYRLTAGGENRKGTLVIRR